MRMFLTIFLLGFAVPAWGAKFNEVVDIGQAAPAWKELPGVDGKTHALADLKEAKLVVVVFLRNHCPVAKAYEGRLREFVKCYQPKGVELLAINVSQLPGESLEHMKRRAEQGHYPFPYLKDDSQKLGQAYGATNTPHVFVLDAQRKIAYMGAIDDDNDPAQVTEAYLKNAVEALLAGKPFEITETLPRGCEIRYGK